MGRFLYPRAGKGQAVLGGVVFTDGVAEADLGPHTAEYLEMLGAVIVRSEEELGESTVEELEQQLRQAGFRVPSNAHKADLVRMLRGEAAQAPVPPRKRDAKPKPQEPAGDVETPSADVEPTPTANEPEPSAQQGAEGSEEETAWPDSPASPSTPTTSDSPSPQEPTPSSSPDDSPEPPAES